MSLNLQALVGLGLLISALGDVNLAVVLLSKLLKSLSLGLRNKHRSEDTKQHEQSVDLHDVVEPAVLLVSGAAVVNEGSEHTLSNNGANLARGSRETMGSGTVAGGEDLTGDDKGGHVGTKVAEKLGKNVKGKKTVVAELVVGKTDDAENDSKDDETTNLNGLAADGINGCDRGPVTGDGTSTSKDNVADADIVQVAVNVVLASITDGTQNDRVVQGKTVVGDIEQKPRASSSKKNLAVLPLTKVGPEVGPRSLGSNVLFTVNCSSCRCLDRGLASIVLLNLGLFFLLSLLLGDIDIKGVSRGFRNGKSEVEGSNGGKSTHSNQNSPHLVDSLDTVVGAFRNVLGLDKGILPGNDADDGNNTTEELAPTLVGKDSAHDGTSPLGSGKLRGNNR